MIDNMKLLRECIDKQIDNKHWVSYYYSNADGDTFSSFTYYEGEICVPEYSKEILHTLNGEKRYKEEEIVPYCKEALKNLEILGDKEND